MGRIEEENLGGRRGVTVTGNGDRFLPILYFPNFCSFCLLCSKMLAFGLIREAFSFTHPCSSQESHLKIEAVSNQVKAASGEIMISSKKAQIISIYFPQQCARHL